MESVLKVSSWVPQKLPGVTTKHGRLRAAMFVKGGAMKKSENYGPGSFSDQYDNRRLRSLDDDIHPGGVTGVPFEDDIDPLTEDMKPNHGETQRRRFRRESPRDSDLGRGEMGTNYNEKFDGNDPYFNLARSNLRPDLHPENSFVGRGPKGWKKSDERILEDVSLALNRSREVDASEIEVRVEDACVYLKGKMRSKGMRRVAEDLVGSVPGVQDVFTNIKIDPEPFRLSPRALSEARRTDES
jgi:hypothetical protein